MWTADESLLHVGVCCISLASQVLLKESREKEITGSHTTNRTYHWVERYRWEVMDEPPNNPDLSPSAFHHFLLLKRPWGSTILLHNGYRGTFPVVKWPGPAVNLSIPSTVDVKTEPSYLYSTYMPPWRVNRQLTSVIPWTP
jgi:hypothetical protein